MSIHSIINKRVDRSLGEKLVYDEIPSETVKKAARDATSHSVGDVLASYTGAVNKLYGNNEGTQDKRMRITRLELTGDQQQEFALVDRDGTFGYQFLEAAGAITLLGAQNEPVMTTKGTFGVHMMGSVATGTFSCSFEGIVPRFGTETI